MKRFALILIALLIAAVARPALAASDFASKLDLSNLRALSLQDRLTIKTWDTFARQAIAQITGRSTLDDHEPVYTLLDIAFRGREAYADRNIIKIKNAQLRIDMKGMPGLDATEAERIRREGTISLNFWRRDQTQQFIEEIQQAAVWKSQAIGEIESGATLLEQLIAVGPSLGVMNFVPPPPGTSAWMPLTQLSGNIPALADQMRAAGRQPSRVEGVDDAKIESAVTAVGLLGKAWIADDAGAAQTQIDALARVVPTMSANYPNATKRHAEVLYNKLYKLTLPGAALYFVAFTCFVVAAYSAGPVVRRVGLGFMIAGLVLHTTGIGMRWWLDQSSTSSWFYSIPIKNQFESVMMSAWFGIIVGLVLELWKKKSLFGAAACFVGWMSLVALFTVPYVFGKDIGNETSRAQGILMSYWLYVHVTLATASYALIGMSFLLGVWWMIRYATAPGAVHAMGANRISADAVEDDRQQSAALAFAFAPTPALAGFPQGRLSSPAPSGAARPATGSVSATEAARVDAVRALLARLDACNLVILQLAFWILGIAIVCGAVWADVSWGRPWGWDAKETFALVTWIVYMVIIHVRIVTPRKAFWTALLTIIGFFVMLFNWVGVNYFLVGLHSYA